MLYCVLDVDRVYERAAAPRSHQSDSDRSANQTHRDHRHRIEVMMTSMINVCVFFSFMYDFHMTVKYG